MNTSIQKIGIILSFSLLLVLMSSCAQAVVVDEIATGDPAGFWKGLWHGIIVVISFIISLFKDDVAVYAAYNTGAWYDLGFILGILIMGGSGGRACKVC